MSRCLLCSVSRADIVERTACGCADGIAYAACSTHCSSSAAVSRERLSLSFRALLGAGTLQGYGMQQSEIPQVIQQIESEQQQQHHHPRSRARERPWTTLRVARSHSEPRNATQSEKSSWCASPLGVSPLNFTRSKSSECGDGPAVSRLISRLRVMETGHIRSALRSRARQPEPEPEQKPHVSSLRVMENGREILVLSVLHMRSSVHACMPVRVCAPCITRVRAPTTACIFRAQHNSYEFV